MSSSAICFCVLNWSWLPITWCYLKQEGIFCDILQETLCLMGKICYRHSTAVVPFQEIHCYINITAMIPQSLNFSEKGCLYSSYYCEVHGEGVNCQHQADDRHKCTNHLHQLVWSWMFCMLIPLILIGASFAVIWVWLQMTFSYYST
jgi:hypothetical protein